MRKTRVGIVDLLRARIVAELDLGTLKPDDRLPGVREIARELGAHERTVGAAVRALGREGLLEVRPRSGAYVTSDALSRGRLLPRVEAWLAGVLVEGLDHGMPAAELPERMRRCLHTVRVSAACVECNTDQLQSIGAELRRDYGFETLPVDLAHVAGGNLPAELRRADLLVTTACHADEIQRLAGRVNKPWVAITLRSDFDAEVSRQLEHGPVHFVVTDPRFADKLRVIYGGPGAANLTPLVVGRDDLAQIPAGAPAYVTRAARDRLGDEALDARTAAPEPTFSRHTAHELLAFVVRTNMAALATRGPTPNRGRGDGAVAVRRAPAIGTRSEESEALSFGVPSRG